MYIHSIRAPLAAAACAVADSPSISRAILALCRFVRSGFGDDVARSLAQLPAKAISRFLCQLDIPNSMHTQGMQMRLNHALCRFPRSDKRMPVRHDPPLRVGIVGEVSQGWGIPSSLGASFPADHVLYMYDLTVNGAPAPQPALPAGTFRQYDLGECYQNGVRSITDRKLYANCLSGLARDIRDDFLDVLILASYSQDGKADLASLVDVPCIINFPVGSDLLFHSKVDYSIFSVPRMGYPLHGDRLHSIFSGRLLPSERCCQAGLFPFDDWGVDPAANPSWGERRPHMVFHGRLGKLTAPHFQELLTSLLKENTSIRLAILGAGSEMDGIQRDFSRRGVGGRIDYHGAVDFRQISSKKARESILGFLRQGRLAPDPWPLCGGRSRQEAYWAGTPTVFMRLVQKNLAGLNGEALLQNSFPSVEVETSAADNDLEYKEKSLRCLFDEGFAKQVLQDQYAIARRNADSSLWWQEVLRGYREWLSGKGWGATDNAACERQGAQ